jgi:hypothetical protein
LVSRLIALLSTNHPADLFSVNDPESTNWLALLDGLTALTNTVPDDELSSSLFPTHQFEPLAISSNSPQAALLVDAVTQARSNQPHGRFVGRHEVLGVPELTVGSPWLNRSNIQKVKGITDEAYETVAAQLLPLLRDDLIGEITRTNGAVSIRFTGFDGITHAIDCSTNFTDWQEVFSAAPENGVIQFTAPEPDDGQPRYYRARTTD